MLFELQAVRVERGSGTVLDGLDLALSEGASCVVGPSGAGKSTLLRLLNRLADPSKGRVLYRGGDVTTLDPLALRREVCLVPQLPALLPGTVAGNVSFGPRLVGREVDPARFLSLAGLPADFGPRDAAQLSVGEQQRVMLARALALEPEVLLLDEPTSALDAAAREAVEATLVDLRRRLRISYVLVTHDLAQAARLADQVVHLRPGGVVGEAA